ncbi:PDZ domain-containing protein [Pseudoxanthomonas wuyuanensis]|uniref:PDZ domain-containing protein n=1 Tax=Pseudoxanthomonas wuyuanensis TaxID=1073196 RepID=A0A286D431_9GAMM|nr:PDZ domain-containing protein [Pseudoxanthomonas wuyuanensis]KAF1719383.1 PDZ domain-containing protein [Pseudoxanthomonas wuyuanensis]SOD53405.1 PDZ domain-containing protein [Pseudoxanthomonas wuyuanensis]
MKLRHSFLSVSLLSASLLSAGLLLAPAVRSQDTADATRRQELAAARAELQRAAKRVAELSGGAGRRGAAMAFERSIERKPVIGVLLAPDPEAGVRVTGVTPDSGAAKAGLKAGDQLLRIGGKAIQGDSGEQRSERARAELADLKAGSPISLTYRRDGRERTVQVVPEIGQPVMVFNFGNDAVAALDAQALAEQVRGSLASLDELDIDIPALTLGIVPEVQQELQRLGNPACNGKDCLLPALTEAFRWNGLNLASLDPQLGRYFGADRGVLVLSTGPELEGLQPGDVIRKVDGKPVSTPREVMNALRGRPADSQLGVEYLRDRRAGNVRITIPKAMPLRIPLPAVPPAPPAPPAPPVAPKPAAAPSAGSLPSARITQRMSIAAGRAL